MSSQKLSSSDGGLRMTPARLWRLSNPTIAQGQNNTNDTTDTDGSTSDGGGCTESDNNFAEGMLEESSDNDDGRRQKKRKIKPTQNRVRKPPSSNAAKAPKKAEGMSLIYFFWTLNINNTFNRSHSFSSLARAH